MTIKVRMVPHIDDYKKEISGIKQVVQAYHRHLPKFDIELVGKDTKRGDFDLLAVHAGAYDGPLDGIPLCAHSHGLYFTADHESAAWEWRTNSRVISSIRNANEVTVPSNWIAETFQRDMRFTPHVIPHGIDWDAWQGIRDNRKHILWAKNRSSDVCDPTPVKELAERFPDETFLSTFVLWDIPNIQKLGVIPFHEMREYVMGAGVYLSSTKESFGIGTLEAMASGVPILGFAHGGNLDLVEHGVNGYLAEPGNYDDLADGLAYCLQYRDMLGANGREMARKWTWEAACEAVAHVYELALAPDPPTVSIVIPSFNYADKVGRAIESAQNQTYQIENIIVVDDGSQDKSATKEAVEKYQGDLRIRYKRIPNSGVAVARNTGIELCNSTFICCLDADDAIEPTFLDVCIKELEADQSLGIAYTGLKWVDGEGKTGISKWPEEFDYDAQLQRRNQIPTACVFKREAWERVGGYRQRFAPKHLGAGSEDAEFFTRVGSIGYGAKKVTDEPLFVYSMGTGYVTGALARGEYSEIDWLSDKPWVKDQQHPFASVATPRFKWSHAVRQYDEPLVSVVIPVGPGHEKEVTRALDSLDSQTFRKWEAIVVWDCAPEDDVIEHFSLAFPYVRQLYTHYGSAAVFQPPSHWPYMRTDESIGAGTARNIGAEIARGSFLVFLDADDWLYPDALTRMLQAWNLDEGIVYTDYVGKAVVGDVAELDSRLQRKVYQWDEETGEAVIGYEFPDYDPVRAQRQPTYEGKKITPWLWCNVTCLIPKSWHDEIGGFDERMVTWEDLDYHYRMAKAGKCYIHLAEELMVYQFHTGKRRDLALQTIELSDGDGLHVYHEIVEYMNRKYEEIEIKMCNCGPKGRSQLGNKSAAQSQSFVGPAQRTGSRVSGVAAARTSQPIQAQGTTQMNDQDFVKVKYLHPNRGSHGLVGTNPFPNRIEGMQMKNRGDGWIIDYGYRSGGTVFTIHRIDAEAQSHLFQIIESSPGRIVREPRPDPTPTSAPTPIPIAVSEPTATAQEPQSVPVIRDARIPPDGDGHIDIQLLPGMTGEISAQLEAAGIQTKEKILELGVKGLQDYRGVGAKKGKMIIDAINAME